MGELSALLQLMRPLEWIKTFGNMVFGALLATAFLPFDWTNFLLAFVAAGPLLWGGLYTINDITDVEKDRLHPMKKNRPLPSGRISKNFAKVFAAALIIASFGIGLYINNIFFVLCLLAMAVNQFLYTLPPFELKKKPVLDLISGSAVNPFFRFFAGWVLFAGNLNAPLLVVYFLVAVNFGGFFLYRISSKKIEQELEYRSSAVMFSEKTLKGISYFFIATAILAFVAAIITGIFPQSYWLLVIGSLLMLPLYWKSITKPKEMDVKFTYRLMYLHYLLLIAGVIVLAYVRI